MRTFIFITLSTFAALFVSAQNYNVALIPDSLKENANAVKRFEEIRIVIKDIDKAIIYHKYAITVLNEAGDKEAEYDNYYDKLVSLSDISGTLYDASGNKIKSIKKKDITDASMNDDMSLMTDTRFKKHNFYYRSYPYTIEYEDEQDLKGIFYLPYWHPVESENFSVQQSRYIIETPLGYTLNYKIINAPKPTTNTAKTTTYTWELRNIRAIEYEPLHPSLRSEMPGVFPAPLSFSIGGFSGDMSTWQSLGMFFLQLKSGRDVLPDNVKKDVHTLTDNISDKTEKIKVLYHYLQKNTRYISVQLGIGGWQPYDAIYVATKKYGDCKALSNYMCALLKEAGIQANYVVINGGEYKKDEVWTDFPNPHFNHIVVCVPNGKDSTWLECTNQTNPFGYMGSFTGNRKALLIADDGGHLVNTPVYTAKDNLQIRSIQAVIDNDGNLKATVQTHFTGEQQELPFSLMHEATEEQKKKYLNRALNLPTYEVTKSDYKEDLTHPSPEVDETLQVESPNYATITGKRLFIKPNLFNKFPNKLPTDKSRKTDIVYNIAYKDVDSVSIQIPDGYKVEAMPKDITVDNLYGKYSIHFSVDGNKIITLRSHVRNEARFPAKDYDKVVKFYETVYDADRSTIVFKKD